MELGGAERALLGLLNALDTNKVDVDLFLNQHTGDFIPLIPKKINLLPEMRGYNAIERPLKDIIKERQFAIAWARLKAKWKHKKYHQSLKSEFRTFDSSVFQYVMNEVTPKLPSLAYLGEYDLAISFLQPHNIVLDKVKAKKKICWIHTDYSTIHINVAQELKVWGKFDYVASISDDCTTSFLKKFPSLRDKILPFENILSPTFVREQAETDNAPEIENFEGIKLVSVGRICNAKNYDNIPYIARILKEKGVNFKWFIVGPGDHADIDKTIEETKTADYIQFLGAKSNPYPYIKAADIYLQPSRYEGKSVTVREAQMLYKPTIVTNYPTAPSQIQDGVDGVIVPMDNEGCAEGIYQVICDIAQQTKLSTYLKTHDYGNEKEVNKIYTLIGI